MYNTLLYTHLGTVLLGFALGTTILLSRKGTAFHKSLGRPYLLAMFVTAIVTLFMPAEVGPTLLGHFGFIHCLSVLTLNAVIVGYRAAKAGNVASHKRAMVMVYFGGILIAGFFAFSPGRRLHTWLLAG